MSIYEEEKELPEDMVREEMHKDEGKHEGHQHGGEPWDCDCGAEPDEDGITTHSEGCAAKPEESEGQGKGEGDGGEGSGQGGSDDPIQEILSIYDARSITAFLNAYPRLEGLKPLCCAGDEAHDDEISAVEGLLCLCKHESGKLSVQRACREELSKSPWWRKEWKIPLRAVKVMSAVDVDEVEGEGFKIVAVLDCSSLFDWLKQAKDAGWKGVDTLQLPRSVGFISSVKADGDSRLVHNGPYWVNRFDSKLVRLDDGSVAVINGQYFDGWYAKRWTA